MYFNRETRRLSKNNWTIPIVGLGALLLIIIVFYQIHHSGSFIQSPKKLRIYLDLKLPDISENLTFTVNDKNFELPNINSIDSLFTCILMPNQLYTITISTN